jgi:ferredoxin-NADP reductase
MDRVVKEFVFPMTQAKRRGEFDILVQRTGDIGSDRFTRALQMLAVGDELAFKAGRKRLQYNEPSDITSRTDGPIEFVTLVASSLGIAPALKMIRSSVDDAEETTVEEVELLWVNEDDNDFVCNEDISHLESKFDKKIYVSRLTEPELYDTEASLLENDNVLSR